MNQESNKRSKSFIDIIGLCCSGLCAIHCLLTPFLLIFLPSLGQTFKNEWVHIGFFVLMASIAIWTIFRHYKMHRSKKIFGLLIFGIMVTSLGFFPPEHFSHDHHWEEAFFILGGILLFIGHLLTIREYKCWEGHCHHHE